MQLQNNPHGILLFILFISLQICNDVYKLVAINLHSANLCIFAMTTKREFTKALRKRVAKHSE